MRINKHSSPEDEGTAVLENRSSRQGQTEQTTYGRRECCEGTAEAKHPESLFPHSHSTHGAQAAPSASCYPVTVTAFSFMVL